VQQPLLFLNAQQELRGRPTHHPRQLPLQLQEVRDLKSTLECPWDQQIMQSTSRLHHQSHLWELPCRQYLSCQACLAWHQHQHRPQSRLQRDWDLHLVHLLEQAVMLLSMLFHLPTFM
jgi:hypothetical protein